MDTLLAVVVVASSGVLIEDIKTLVKLQAKSGLQMNGTIKVITTTDKTVPSGSMQVSLYISQQGAEKINHDFSRIAMFLGRSPYLHGGIEIAVGLPVIAEIVAERNDEYPAYDDLRIIKHVLSLSGVTADQVIEINKSDPENQPRIDLQVPQEMGIDTKNLSRILRRTLVDNIPVSIELI